MTVPVDHRQHGDMYEQELEVRGIPRSHIISYLREIGAETNANDDPEHGLTLMAEKWKAHVKPEDHLSFSSVFIIPRMYVHFSGSQHEVEEAVFRFRRKITRAGG